MNEKKRICLVGSLGQDPSILGAAEKFEVPIIISETGKEYATDENYITYFILDEFRGPIFDYFCQVKCRLVILTYCVPTTFTIIT